MGRGGVVSISGEPGVGKTATVLAFAAEATNRGATVLWGTCFEGTSQPPYGPWTDATGALLTTPGPARRPPAGRGPAPRCQAGLRRGWGGITSYSTEPALSALRCPLLHVGGAFPADVERLRALCPQLQVAHVRGRGHFIQLTAADEVNAVLADFVATVRAGSAATAAS